MQIFDLTVDSCNTHLAIINLILPGVVIIPAQRVAVGI